MTNTSMEPERRVSTEPIFNGRIIQVRVDTVSLPNGRQATREIVEHAAAVVIVPIDDEGNVVLVRQYRYPVEEALLEAPAGIIEDSELPDVCAQRELQEETGYRSGDLRSMGGFWSSPGFCTEYMHAYIAKDLTPSKLEADDDENIQVEKVPLSQVADLIRSGEIRDAKTVAVLLMATCLFENV